MSTENVKEFIKKDGAICQFLDSLTNVELDWLLNSPFFGTELVEHAAFCKRCGAKTEAAHNEIGDSPGLLEDGYLQNPHEGSPFLKEFFEAMTSLTAESELEQSWKILPFTDRQDLVLAASAEGGHDSQTADTEPVPFGTLTISGREYQVADDEEGRVFIRGDVPLNATHLVIGEDVYELGPITEGDKSREVVGAGSADVSDFLKQLNSGVGSQPCFFKTREA